MRICVYGSGSEDINKIYTDATYELGCIMAQKGHTLVFGGGDSGIMGSCAKGVHDNDGKSIGIAPKWIENFEPLCDECTRFIYVESMDERKNKFLENSDAIIVAPGGMGTLDEFFEAITLKKLEQHNKDIIIFNIDNFYEKMFEMLDEMNQKGFLYKPSKTFKKASTVDEIFELLENK
ncbi:TIGR00730 family Rossman fold protein [Methanobrevibacter sp.]|uniref:LOG family protein n=1 Tax=Methanobrevibacter sp. TaxID=66852 RepID=UPI0026DF2E34|nr:TIGR00730 family Rossman fold protein [Methanobrevibacter sp.]MDO5823096.1 TIGR00730 family Rossman fold protein [Methanobrevibacter sp.]